MKRKWAIRSLLRLILIICGLSDHQQPPELKHSETYKRGIALPTNPPKDNRGKPLEGYNLEYIPLQHP